MGPKSTKIGNGFETPYRVERWLMRIVGLIGVRGHPVGKRRIDC